ncbi:hypothetical protein [Flavobacterium sp. B17]|uniref:hypothetical protein n=1 Tax=Flavobacterium sp. B17 TaxID=95618 RepID=UPI00034A9101|nr:hypothetical protein [Flavobacterium sp. B17]
MNKKLKVLGVFLLLLCSQSFFSQQQSDDDVLKFKSENTSRNLQKKTTVFTGNVSLSSKAISFENAEKVSVDETTNEVKIYKPKNFKIIHVDGLIKKGKKSDEDVIVYNTKTKILSM